MTDPSYDSLPTLIGELKRAAIDAYMKSQGWHLHEDRYHLSDYEVTRPGTNGEGGGDWDWNGFWDIGNEHQDEKWRGAFDDVRGGIDETMKRWLDLPDPSLLTDDVEQLRQANRLLAYTPSGSGGASTGAGNIGGYLQGMNENLDSMSGDLVATYKADFLLQLEKAIGGHHGITVILGGAMAAAQVIWEQARQTVADIVAETRDALNAYANDNSVDWTVVLKVAGYAVEGVSIFATGGVSTALKGAAVGLKILTDVDSSKGDKASTPGLDYEGLIKGLGTALEELSTAIKVEEGALQTNLETNFQNIENDKGSYDLKRPALLDVDDVDPGDGGLIVISRPLVDEITGTYLPKVSGELDKAKSQVFLATYQANRDATVGVGASGYSSEFGDVQWLVRDLIGDLSWEVLNSAKTLELAVEDVEEADTGAGGALAEHKKKVESGSGYDPWDG